MQLSNAPAKIVEAFAINGNKRIVPVPTQIPITPGAASYNDGFPPLNATAVNAGGIPPSILDMNGILNEATALDWWMSAGGSFKFDSVFAAAVGGYPIGARVLNAAGTGFWINLTDNNSTNPDSGAAPTGWIPDRASASVYASAQQTLASASATKVLWDTVEFDSFGLWNVAGQYFKVLWAGKYRLTGSVLLPSPAGQNLGTLIYKNGTLAKQSLQFPQVSDVALSYSFDAILNCAANDTLDVRMNVSQSSVLCGQVGSNAAYVYGQLQYLGA